MPQLLASPLRAEQGSYFHVVGCDVRVRVVTGDGMRRDRVSVSAQFRNYGGEGEWCPTLFSLPDPGSARRSPVRNSWGCG